VTTMGYMFRYASDFNQDLCAWGEYYSSSINYFDMFYLSKCESAGSPTKIQGPWCKASCPE